MYKKIPKTKKVAASIFVMVLIAFGIYGFSLGSMQLLPAPVIAQFFGVVFLVTGIYIYSTNVLKEMVYQITPTEREVTDEELAICGPRVKYDFIVAQHKAIRDVVMCCVGLDEVKSAVEVNRLNRAEYRKKDKKKKRYSYDTQFAPSRQLRVEINDDTVVFLTYDEELMGLLNKKF